MKSLLSLIAIGLIAMTLHSTDSGAEPLPENVLVMELKDGIVRIEMLPELAPQHVERIKTLTREGFYDGIVFHRVIDGFMAQTGDPTGTGRGGSDLPDVPAEFSAEPFERGVVGMARSQSPNSATRQFFIILAPARFLDRQDTVWGRVIEGMEYVDHIQKHTAGAQSGTVNRTAQTISPKHN